MEILLLLETFLIENAVLLNGEKISAAREALEAGDYSLADDIFADIEAQRDIEVQVTARAAYGRGLVAEEQVRWGGCGGTLQQSGAAGAEL